MTRWTATSGQARRGIAYGRLDDEWSLVVDPFFSVFPLASADERSAFSSRPLSLYRSINYDTEFAWFDDGRLQLGFSFSSVGWSRWGARADDSQTLLGDAGFDLRDFEDDEESMMMVMENNDERRAFALAELLTGVAITPHLLRSTTFTCALLPRG